MSAALFAAVHELRAVASVSVGLAAHILYLAAAELELEAIGLRAVEEALL